MRLKELINMGYLTLSEWATPENAEKRETFDISPNGLRFVSENATEEPKYYLYLQCGWYDEEARRVGVWIFREQEGCVPRTGSLIFVNDSLDADRTLFEALMCRGEEEE